MPHVLLRATLDFGALRSRLLRQPIPAVGLSARLRHRLTRIGLRAAANLRPLLHPITQVLDRAGVLRLLRQPIPQIRRRTRPLHAVAKIRPVRTGAWAARRLRIGRAGQAV